MSELELSVQGIQSESRLNDDIMARVNVPSILDDVLARTERKAASIPITVTHLGRQGDVMLRTQKVPAKAKVVQSEGPIVLAHGASTGHNHTIHAAKASLLEDGPMRYLRIEADGALLIHDEHGTIRYAPGEYVVVRQVEGADFVQVID